MREIGFQRTYIFKIFRGSMPPNPPRKVRLRRTITFSITYEHPLENLSYAPDTYILCPASLTLHIRTKQPCECSILNKQESAVVTLGTRFSRFSRHLVSSLGQSRWNRARSVLGEQNKDKIHCKSPPPVSRQSFPLPKS